MEVLIFGQRPNRAYYHLLLSDISLLHVDYFENLNRSIEALENKIYDLILIDYTIPLTDLVSFAKAYSLNEHNNNVSIIILTYKQNQIVNSILMGITNNIKPICIEKKKNISLYASQMAIKSFIDNDNFFDILIIDDSIEDCELYSRLLERIFSNYTIDHCESAEEGIERIKHNKYSLILLDYYLYGMNGIDFLSEIAPLKQEAPIIALTGSGNEEVAINFMKMGVGDYITKSNVNFDILSESILNVLKKSRNVKIEQEKQHELSLFAYNVAHDLKSPLGRINSYAQLIYKKHPELESRYIQNIIEDSQYMESFLSNLLLYSEMGRSRLSLSKVDLNSVFRQSISNLELEIKNKNAVIKIEEMPEVYGHYISLVQLFQNLIANSIKYCTKTPIIKVFSRIEDNNLHIELSDNGIGIDKDKAKDIFKPFTRIDNNLNTLGTGIGLAICLTIVKQHHAQIKVESNEVGGARFIITFSLGPLN
ncbi:MAG: response regulator [Rickettsiales bacterium]|jgi:signal transduction histidine kinase|nr:response regulator [Rickettsiales bacterium]